MALKHNLSMCLTFATLARRPFSLHADKFRLLGEELIKDKKNAYEVLGVSRTCSEESIRKAFRELAKQTHPDMQSCHTHISGSARFIVVLSAYRILSNPRTREEYDAYLHYSSKTSRMHCGNKRNPMSGQVLVRHELEAADWLQWCRNVITDMISEHEIGVGQSLQQEFQENLQAALKRAYFGPCHHELDFLPDCFETEERASATEIDVLHLVSGRNMFGAVRQVSGMELLRDGFPKHVSLNRNSGITSWRQNSSLSLINNADMPFVNSTTTTHDSEHHLETMPNFPVDHDQRAFVDLELYLFGNLIARATRAPAKSCAGSFSESDRMDKITIYLCSDRLSWNDESSKPSEHERNIQEMLLGTVVGLGATDYGGKGRVYSPHGKHTHIIWQFRTPLVKHLHWFKVGDQGMLCECRSTRARLPPSKFWLFEPRCGKHNIGGWYIETLWRNGSNQPPGPGYTRSMDWTGKSSGLLHPAMYIIGAAYKTLDAEALKRQNLSLISMIFKQPTFRAVAAKTLQWCREKLHL